MPEAPSAEGEEEVGQQLGPEVETEKEAVPQGVREVETEKEAVPQGVREDMCPGRVRPWLAGLVRGASLMWTSSQGTTARGREKRRWASKWVRYM